MTRVIYNGKIYHGENRQGENRQGKFCQALRVEGGRIRALGDSEELLAALPAGAETIDAAGALVLPGFHDSHLHLRWLGRYAGMVDGTGADSVEDLIRRGRALIARDKPLPGTYVQGGGVNPDLFTAEKRDLNREDLDRVSSEHPVIMSRHCGHTIYCNSLALRMAGLAEHAPDVEGGTIEKDGAGRPTGVLRENAAGLIRRLVPEPTRSQMRENLKRAMTTALSLGITALGTNDSQGPDYDEVTEVYRSIYAEAENGGRGAGFPRVSLQCGISADEAWLDHIKERGGLPGTALWEGERGVFLRMGSVKLFMDGTLGGQTAWMTEPYRDKPETRGFPVLEEEQLRAFVRRAASYNMQVIVHAIGDAAMEAVISALEEVTGPGANPLRHGIVHCQITRRAQLERMARNRLLALVQPVFLADDMYILESRVGPGLASGSYAWGTMERLGLPVSYGTDAPVSDLNPLLGISWAVTRQDPRRGFYPPGGFCPAERVDLAAAVDAYTAASAYAAFAERELGRAAPGFWADLCFIDRDIFSLPPGEIHRAQVIRTMIAGDTVWEA